MLTRSVSDSEVVVRRAEGPNTCMTCIFQAMRARKYAQKAYQKKTAIGVWSHNSPVESPKKKDIYDSRACSHLIRRTSIYDL